MEKTALTKDEFERRWKRARQVARIAGALPFVRYIGVNGSMARGVARRGSDIDFFVVIEHGRLWMARLAVTVCIQLLGVRRVGRRIAGRICLNRFFTTAALEIAPPTLGNARTFASQVPLYDAGGWHTRFAATNRWVKEFGYRFAYGSSQLPVASSQPEKNSDTGNLPLVYPVLSRVEPRERSRGATGNLKISLEKALSGRFGNWLEGIVKRLQLKRIAADPRTWDPHGRVVFTDRELTFNPPKV